MGVSRNMLKTLFRCSMRVRSIAWSCHGWAWQRYHETSEVKFMPLVSSMKDHIIRSLHPLRGPISWACQHPLLPSRVHKLLPWRWALEPYTIYGAPAKQHTVILLDTRPAHNFVGGDPRLPSAALIRDRPTFFCELLRSVTILSRRARLAR